MKKEYQNSMKEISLSESDKARILANVKKACEESESSDKIVPLSKNSRFSTRRIVSVAAGFAVLLIGAVWVHSQTVGRNEGGLENPGGTQVANHTTEVIWEELESVDDIPEQTDCRIYTLGKGAKGYKVSKVEVAKEQKHVRLTYKNRKDTDEILFEYQEAKEKEQPVLSSDETGAADQTVAGDQTESGGQVDTLQETNLVDKFKEKQELTTEKVGETDVTMYGEKKCEGMTWQEDNTSFAVTLSKACSKKKAKELVKDTKEEKFTDTKLPDRDLTEKGQNNLLVVRNAIGWDGTEDASTEEERDSILQKFYDDWGFKIMIHEPASEITYKQMGDCESYSFYYPDNPKWKDCLFIGYVGWHSCPPGVKKGFETYTTEVMKDDTLVKFKKNLFNQKMFTFHKGDLYFVFLLTNWKGELTQDMVQDIVDTIEIIEENDERSYTDKVDEPIKKPETNTENNGDSMTSEPTREPDDESDDDTEPIMPTPVPDEITDERMPLEE